MSSEMEGLDGQLVETSLFCDLFESVEFFGLNDMDVVGTGSSTAPDDLYETRDGAADSHRYVLRSLGSKC